MSASPSATSSAATPNGGTSNGPTPNGTTPNGNHGRTAPSLLRRKKADPLVRPRPRKPLPSAATNGKPTPQNTKTKQSSEEPLEKLPNSAADALARANPKKQTASTVKDPKGFSEPPQRPERTSYMPVISTKRALLKGLRFHVAKLTSKNVVSPRDEKSFRRPVRLYRRDPRDTPAPGGGVKLEDAMGVDSKDGVMMDDKDREQYKIAQQERQAQRQLDMAQVAPAVNQVPKSDRGANKRKTQQVYRTDQTPEQQKATRLRYEEALPWHLEDFDHRNIWVSNYEAALSEMHVTLKSEGKRFRLGLVEKWYKFTAKNHFTPLTIEEAELRMGQKVKEPRWMMKTMEEQRQKNEEKQNRRQGAKLFVGKLEEAAGDGGVTNRRSEFVDSNDLDYEEDRFADDEENQLFEGEEEEAKEAENRIKRDQLQANVFDLKDEREYDREEDEEKKEKEMAKKLGKGLRRALRDREKNLVYDDDSDSNPYSDDSTTEDEDEKTTKEGEQAKPDEKNDKTKDKKEKDGSRLPSGASTKGTNTPSGRKKHSDPLKTVASTLKRPGSPNLSELSGTESLRKKSKKKHGGASSLLPTATSTPKPGSRAMSPAPPSSSAPEASRPAGVTARSTSAGVDTSKAGLKNVTSDKKRGRPGAGSGSDGDVTTGEMSDGTRRKKMKGTPMGTIGSRQASRAGSPNPPTSSRAAQAPRSKNVSRAASPAARAPPSQEAKFPTAAEIAAAIPPTGMTISQLTAHFGGRLGGKQNREMFINIVRQVSKFGGADRKLLVPKTTTGGTASPASPASPMSSST
ncbi:MAG: hypothetical protein M1823_000517 [Watsoniomyces obsoletus]|nr:MAG: hypothetical protein M1823_000517 [Watsoniomyces obsoletus]